MRSWKAICTAAALVVLLAPAAHADEWNKRTYLTFSGPVQIPGATLSAGTYTFELASPDSSRHVIRVSEKDSGKNIALFMTIPNDRMDAPNDNLIMFSERPAGQPQAIQAWFYPGDRIGEEFVYPKAQAVKIAKATRKGVLATEGGGVTGNGVEAQSVASVRGANVGRVDENGNMTKDDGKAATTTAKSAEPQSTTAQSNPTSSGSSASRAHANTAKPESAGTSGSSRRRLPRTASNLAAIELLSVLSLAGAFGVRRLRQSA